MKIVRIPIDLNSDDQEIRINLEDEFQSLDVLSLNITSNDVYSRVKSDFGVIVGRVTTSQGLGIQNAKINIFIPLTEEDKSRIEITKLYRNSICLFLWLKYGSFDYFHWFEGIK